MHETVRVASEVLNRLEDDNDTVSKLICAGEISISTIQMLREIIEMNTGTVLTDIRELEIVICDHLKLSAQQMLDIREEVMRLQHLYDEREGRDTA